MSDTVFTEIFWTLFLTSSIGLILALGRMCYKSKCSQIDVCCIKIVRNVEIEEHTDIEENININRRNEETKI